MPEKSRSRSSEQKLRKMLNEEKMLVGLELAIKKEQFKNPPIKQEFYKVSVKKDAPIKSKSIAENNFKTNRILTFLQNKIGF